MLGQQRIAKMAASIAKRAMIEVQASEMSRRLDIFARLAILEAAAGLPVGRWSRSPQIRKDVLVEPAEHFPGIYPDWITAGNIGLVDMMQREAMSFTSRAMAEETVSRILSGLSLPGTPGGALRHIGMYLAPSSLKSVSSIRSAFFIMKRHVKQRAGDPLTVGVQKESDPRNVVIGPAGPEEDAENPRMHDIGNPESDADYLAMLLSGHSRTWLYDKLMKLWSAEGAGSRASDLKVMEEWIKDPNRSNTEIGQVLGTSGSFVNAAIKRLVAIAVEAIEHNPTLRSVRDSDPIRVASTRDIDALVQILRRLSRTGF